MALRKIALEGEACLSKMCRPVTDFNSRLHTLLDDLADTLADSGGVGLAAPQVGVLRRVCVVLDEEDQLIELVNPEIIYTEGEQTGLEGCFCNEIEHLDGHLFVENTDRLMEGEELQKWLEAHADEYEIEEEEDK